MPMCLPRLRPVEKAGNRGLMPWFVHGWKVNGRQGRALNFVNLPSSQNKEGLWAVTVQANWRIVFRFEFGDAHVVDYLDYH